jgi:4-hydroxy-3-methylbut-2-enyl diphosphate reductase
MADPLFVRRGFGLRSQIAPLVDEEYGSEMLERVRANGNVYHEGGVTIRLAKELGFCYGVDRAVDLAYETRARFPSHRLFLTAQIIHNPHVNRRLEGQNIAFLNGNSDRLTPDDVVIIPAFGVTAEVLEQLRSRGCLLVDTTCTSVINVWRNVERNARDGFTSVIHGKIDHEETRATASRALQGGKGHFLAVRDLSEGELVAACIRGTLGSGELLEHLGHAASPGFDPRRHLERIGLANQTTMLASQSLKIGRCLQAAMAERYGADHVDRFRAFDTICRATEDRQQAVTELMDVPPDVMVVVGGFNSSNTSHLAEIAAGHCAAYHIEDADDLLARDRIRHKLPGKVPAVREGPWLPSPPVHIGLTAGASTPGVTIGEVIHRLLELGNGA